MKFNPTLYKANCCGDIFYSRYPGEFRHCDCKQSAVDETEFFARLFGSVTPVGRLYEVSDDERRVSKERWDMDTGEV